MTIIGVKSYHTTKSRKCEDCKLEIKIGELYHRIYGYAERGDKPYEIISCNFCFNPVTKMCYCVGCKIETCHGCEHDSSGKWRYKIGGVDIDRGE